MAIIKSGNLRRQRILAEMEAARQHEEENTAKPVEYSKLKIYIACATAGIWDKLEKWMSETTINGVNLLKAYTEANIISDDHPLFKQYLALAQCELNLTDDAIHQILIQCKI